MSIMDSGVVNFQRKWRILLLTSSLCSAFIMLLAHPAQAATGINEQINFQGRLFNAQGAVVPDGMYNIQFKIYQDGDGLTAGNTTGIPAGSLKWTESHLNSNSRGVQVKNGFLSVQLGSVTPFGTNVDWNQNTLWLSMNVAGTNASCTPFTACTPDGEMVPMKRLSSTPYSLNTGLLGGYSSADFVRLGRGLQSDVSTNTASIAINKTGTGNLVALQSNGADAFTLSGAGDVIFGANANHSLTVASAAANTAGRSLTFTAGAAGTGASALTGGNLVLQGGIGGGTNGNGGNVTIDAGQANGSGTAGTISIGSTFASAIQIGSATTLSVTSTGASLSAAGQTLLSVNSAVRGASTAGNTVKIGDSAGTDIDTTILVVDSATAEPTTNVSSLTGGMYYNTTLNKFRCFENGTWKDCDTNTAASLTLQDAYDNTSSPALITTTSGTKDIIIRSGGGFNSTGVFRIQNDASQNLFVADTANQRVAIGPAAVPANGVLTIGTNTTDSSGGLYFGTDTYLYRNGTNQLRVDGNFQAAGIVQSVQAVAGSNSFTTFVSGDSQNRFAITNNGVMNWGSGALPADTNLYRSAANVLRTDDAFTTAGLLTGQAGATLSGAAIDLNSSSNFATNINTGTSTGAVNIGNNTGNTAVTIDSGTGTVAIGTGAQARTINIGTGGANQAVTVGSLTTASSTTIHGGTGNINLFASGSTNTGVLVRNSTNSTNSFLVQNSAGTPDVLFRADTVNNRVFIGNATASSGVETTLLVVDAAPTINLPSGANGGIVYDSTDNKFKIYENGQYKILCNTTDQACGSAAATTFQDVYNNSTSPATVTTTSATKDIIFKSGVGFNSTSIFQIQNASSQNVFVADTANQRIAIGPAATPANATLTVGTNTTLATGGIYFGTDTSLYRSASNSLTTGGAFTASGLMTGQSGATISGAAISLNLNSNFATNINTGTSTGVVTLGNDTGNTPIVLNSGTSAIVIGNGAQNRTVSIATGSANQNLSLGSTNGTSTTLIRGGTNNITIQASGVSNTGTIVKTSGNSTAAFQIQSSGGTPDVLFLADSTNNRLYVGNQTASTSADTTLLVIDSASTTNLPVGVNGGIVYDSTDNKFKIYENGQYKIICNTTDLGCGAAGLSQSLQDAYNNSSTPAEITTTSATKDIIFKSGSGFNSTAVFQVQSSSSDLLFRVDTSNNRVRVGNATATGSGDSTLFVVDTASTTNLPVGVNGGIVYDSTDNKFKIYENGAYKTLCNTSDLGCGSAGIAQTLQDAYNNSPDPAVITSSSATKNVIIRSGIGLNSTGLFQIQNASSQTLFVANTVDQRLAVGPGALAANTVLTVGTDTTAASGGVYFGTDTNLYRVAASTLRTDGNFQLGEGATRSVSVAGRSTNAAGNGLTIAAGDAGNGAAAFAGGNLTLQGGNAAGTGNAAGGNVMLTGGVGVGTGTRGLVILDTPAFTTTTNTSCSANCTITLSNVDNNGNVIVNAATPDIEITLPDPSNTTAGRIVYITAANASSDFTLIVNGGGVGNQVAMRQNTSATMIWNGVDWTAAGASSSTTLQAAYNNTLTSAGGAEIVLNNTASSNGLTIRNNANNPIMGAIFEVQSSIGNNLLSVNNNAVEYVSNGGGETAGATSTTFPANTWEAAPAGGTVTRNTNTTYIPTGQASIAISTTGANQGARNNLVSGLAVNTSYQLSVSGRLNSGSFANLDLYYSRNGGTTLTPCATAQTLITTNWSKITCIFTTDGTVATNPDIIIRQSDGTARTYWLDNLSITLSTDVSTPPNVQVGGGIYGGTPTLLTLDRSSSPPVANGNDVYYGSMYYDTTSGRIQCYEADGWGACGSAPDNFVNLVPEYAGAVLNGTGVGTMHADFCANSGALSVNSTLCASGQALNYYRWTSPQATQQTYSIYVTYQLPAAFKHFQSDNTVSLSARTDHITNGAVTYQMFRSEGGSLTACGSETTVTTSANTWQTVGINGNEFSGCGFSTASANSNVIFKINVKANSNANVYVGTLSFTTIGQ